MNINKYKNALIEFGLTENEVKVYLATLSLGPTTILSISKETDIRRTTVYEIIKSLISKGLMVTELKGFKKLFCATHPQNLISIFENKKDNLEIIVPELTAFYKIEGTEDNIKTYQGIDSIKSLYREILNTYRTGDFSYIIGNNEKFFALDPKFFNKYIEDRAKLNLDVRIIVDDSESSRERKKYARNFNSQIRILPKNANLPANFTVNKNLFLTQTLENKVMALTTSNKDIIGLQKNLFEIIWNSLPE
jgi:sugar-specific transcriptional regulator TrmB